MGIFDKCNHKWKHIKDERFDEKLKEIIMNLESLKNVNEDNSDVFRDIFQPLTRRGVISIMECEICRIVKHVKTYF